MRTSRRIAVAMTAALVSMSALTGTASAASSKSPSAPAGGNWCWPVAGQHHEVGPVILTSSANTTAQDTCSMGVGEWWRGINGSPDVFQLLSVPLASNLFFQIHVQGEFAEQIGGIKKPVGRWDNSRF